MTLYEIDRQIKEIIDNLYDAMDENGEVGEVDFSILEQLKEERQTKLENITLYIKNLEAEADAIKNEIDALTKRKKRLETRANGLRGLLIKSISENGDKEFSTARCFARISERDVTDILDENIIPKEYMREKIKYEPDKTAIKNAINSGKVVAGARVIKNKSLKIE